MRKRERIRALVTIAAVTALLSAGNAQPAGAAANDPRESALLTPAEARAATRYDGLLWDTRRECLDYKGFDGCNASFGNDAIYMDDDAAAMQVPVPWAVYVTNARSTTLLRRFVESVVDFPRSTVIASSAHYILVYTRDDPEPGSATASAYRIDGTRVINTICLRHHGSRAGVLKCARQLLAAQVKKARLTVAA